MTLSSKQNDQADALRQAIQDVTDNKAEETEQNIPEEDKQLDDSAVEVDILNLPPRNEVHKTSKMRWKINLPLLRFIFIVVLLLVLAGLIIWFV